MNELDKFYETFKNKDHIHRYRTGGGKYTGVLEIETDKLRIRGRRWHEMSRTEKRKFENLMFLAHPLEKLHFRYI